MLDKVKQTINKYNLFCEGDRVLLGVSGGADSTALLHILHVLAEELGILLHVVHVEHGLRGEESLEDADFVKRLAKSCQLPFSIASPSVKQYAEEHGMSTQVAARELRYKEFLRIARTVGATKIALAHHSDDQAETVLFRILRGTSISGLSGIKVKRKLQEFEIVRPLLEISREEIEDYCLSNKIDYRTDSSNASTYYMRNKIRLQILPFLQQEYNGNVKRALIRLGEIAADEDEFMEQQAKNLFTEITEAKNKSEIIVVGSKLLNVHIALQRRLITLILYYLCGHTNEWESKHLEQILQLVGSQNPSARIDLPGGLVAWKEYDRIHIATQTDLPDSNPHWKPELLVISGWSAGGPSNKEFKLPRFGLEGTMEVLEGAVFPADEWEAVFDLQDLEGQDFYVRTRQEGDVIQPYGLNGTKKLKDLFMEARVPRGRRDTWPLLTMGNQIVWIPGIRRSQVAPVTVHTRNTLRIRVTRY